MLKRLFSKQAQPSVPEVDVATFAANHAAGDADQIVDVREPNEWASGHLPGATLIPLGVLASRARELDRTRPIVVVCRSGNRSKTATSYLLENGFRDVTNLSGGVNAWTKAGHQLVR